MWGETIFMMKEKNEPQNTSMTRLLEIMARLRAENGCPWDREQTHRSLRKYVIEETYEVVDAIDKEDDALLQEELGDLLLQVVFHARIAEEEGRFTFGDVVDGISEKMIRRHPHVFGEGHCDTADDVVDVWQEIKSAEKAAKQPSRFDIPPSFPALYRADKIQKAAADVGFDWDNSQDNRDKILEELSECDRALQGDGDIQEEIGDLLFAVVNWSRFHRVDAEEALRESNAKFIRRFEEMESLIDADGKQFEGMTLAEMDVYWEKAKLRLR